MGDTTFSLPPPPELAEVDVHRLEVGDLVVYALGYSITFSGLVGAVLEIDGSKAKVMWINPIGDPVVTWNSCRSLLTVDDSVARRLSKQCEGLP